MMNKDIPIEAAVKYIIAERDKYKSKLEQLIPYTKSLESKVKQLEKKNEDLKKVNKGLTKEITQSDMYKGLFERYKRLKRDNETLLEQIGKLVKP